MKRAVHAVGAVALVGAGAVMLLAAVGGIAFGLDTDGALLAAGLVSAVAVTAFAETIVRETRWALRADGFDMTGTDLGNAAAVALAAPVTFLLSVEVGIGAVVASALVGLCAQLVTETYGAPAYCGSFVGMATPAGGAELGAVTAAGGVAAVVFVAAKRAFNGFGGKLGTTAFVGCLAVAVVSGLSPGSGSVPEAGLAAALVVAGAVAAVATLVVSVRLGHGPVVGSAVVGLVAGVVCPPLFAAGDAIAAVAFCASFAGMATPERIPGIGSMLLAGAVSGIVFVGAVPYFVGFGGKLGTIAFVACLVVAGMRSLALALAPVGSDAVFG